MATYTIVANNNTTEMIHVKKTETLIDALNEAEIFLAFAEPDAENQKVQVSIKNY